VPAAAAVEPFEARRPRRVPLGRLARRAASDFGCAWAPPLRAPAAEKRGDLHPDDVQALLGHPVPSWAGPPTSRRDSYLSYFAGWRVARPKDDRPGLDESVVYSRYGGFPRGNPPSGPAPARVVRTRTNRRRCISGESLHQGARQNARKIALDRNVGAVEELGTLRAAHWVMPGSASAASRLATVSFGYPRGRVTLAPDTTSLRLRNSSSLAPTQSARGEQQQDRVIAIQAEWPALPPIAGGRM
jgi:hypothetical protein